MAEDRCFEILLKIKQWKLKLDQIQRSECEFRIRTPDPNKVEMGL